MAISCGLQGSRRDQIALDFRENAADRIRRQGLISNARNRPYRESAAAASGGNGRGVDHGRGYKAAPGWRQESNRVPTHIGIMRGLDPRIHQSRKTLSKRMDCRVKPGNDT
jgi:hypothetical protein